MRKITKRLQDVQKAAISEELALPTSAATSARVGPAHREADGDAMEAEASGAAGAVQIGGKEGDEEDDSPAKRAFKEKQREMIQALDLNK